MCSSGSFVSGLSVGETGVLGTVILVATPVPPETDKDVTGIVAVAAAVALVRSRARSGSSRPWSRPSTVGERGDPGKDGPVETDSPTPGLTDRLPDACPPRPDPPVLPPPPPPPMPYIRCITSAVLMLAVPRCARWRLGFAFAVAVAAATEPSPLLFTVEASAKVDESLPLDVSASSSGAERRRVVRGAAGLDGCTKPRSSPAAAAAAERVVLDVPFTRC